eukprot:scaffold118976_cov12-Tisochrysis_lutea.AAC.1
MPERMPVASAQQRPIAIKIAYCVVRAALLSAKSFVANKGLQRRCWLAALLITFIPKEKSMPAQRPHAYQWRIS